eukprot:350500-Chlamydomonas_euryale.AAC.24
MGIPSGTSRQGHPCMGIPAWVSLSPRGVMNLGILDLGQQPPQGMQALVVMAGATPQFLRAATCLNLWNCTSAAGG